MSKLLFYDVETTGLLAQNPAVPLDHPSQPRIVQLAAILCDSDGSEVTLLSALMKPDNFTIPAGMTHGISNEYAQKWGVPVKSALYLFSQLAFVAEELLAFNHTYDISVMRGEFMRLGKNSPFDSRKTTCVMQPMTALCKLPKPSYQSWNKDEFKWPKLIEAHQYCYGRGFDKAHDALADVRATIAVWKWHQNHIKAEFAGQEMERVAEATAAEGKEL